MHMGGGLPSDQGHGALVGGEGGSAGAWERQGMAWSVVRSRGHGGEGDKR